MDKSAYDKAMNTGVPHDMVGEAQRWVCPDCGSTDLTLEWQFDKKAPREDIVWEGRVYPGASYKKWVQWTYYHESTCPEIADLVRLGGVDRWACHA